MARKNPLEMFTANQLWAASGAGVGLTILSRIVFPDAMWLTGVFVGLTLLAAGLATLRGWGRSAAYGLNSVITVLLTLGLLLVINFLVMQKPLKHDFTKDKLLTLSDQTEKLMKGLKSELQGTLFAKYGEKEQVRPILEDYQGYSTKFKVEYVDPDKEPTRVKEAGVKKYGSLQLKYEGRTAIVDEVNEEKLTNAIIKLTRGQAQVLCPITGHGEKDFESKDRDGLFAVKGALEDQSYQIKAVNLPQEGKIPAECSAIAIVGASRSFFENEIKTIDEYLKGGGSAFIALDLSIKGLESAPELLALLEKWNITSKRALVVDNNPIGQLMGMDASVSMVQTFSTDSPITKDVQTQAVFPFTRPVEIKPGAPAGINLMWLAKTSPRSWGETDLSEIANRVLHFNEGKDIKGPVSVAVTLEGKQADSKAPKNTRMVVFGNANFATNYYARFGGNNDLAVNAISWAMTDESMISIRKREEGPGKIELTGAQQITIFWITVIFLPLAVTAFGIFHWLRRRKL
ncbi:MAG TPA: GldG family protein [Bdellovibrionota bacterium]|nr:GldG family protein [Bdellovibrionota bacterium]